MNFKLYKKELILTGDEATTLSIVLRRISGDPKTSHRKYTHSILEKLNLGTPPIEIYKFIKGDLSFDNNSIEQWNNYIQQNYINVIEAKLTKDEIKLLREYYIEHYKKLVDELK